MAMGARTDHMCWPREEQHRLQREMLKLQHPACGGHAGVVAQDGKPLHATGLTPPD